MDDHEIIANLICIGYDGATIMQDHNIGLCVYLQVIIAPYMIPFLY